MIEQVGFAFTVTILLQVLEQTLSRTGEAFYDDVALVDEPGNYLGMISLRK